MESIEDELAKNKSKLERINREIKQLNDEKNKVLDMIGELNDKLQLRKSEALAQKDWISQRYSFSEKVQEALKNVFHLKCFRPLQLSTINAIMSGQDVILIMPTGGGKSLCYQLPAVVSEGLTLVISPLISLMEDQISSLRKLNVSCELLSSNSTKSENNAIQKEMATKGSKLRILYVTPERLAKSKRFMSNLQKCYRLKMLDRIAIDEVHCCSHWGHDFRPDYKFLNILKNTFAGVPIMGLTATATHRVTIDVQKMLNLQGCLILKASFNRGNLFYQVIEKPAKPEDCMDLLSMLLKRRYAQQSGIIYTTTIKDTETIRDELKKRGLRVGCYHANMEPKDRSQTYEKWMNQTYQAVVATIAFGLGIDKPDVRFVIHHALSKSMENFYQESGRAGRDGKRSECLVLYRLGDVFKLSPMVFSTQTGIPNLYGMLEYCIDTQRCRRTMIAEHFDEMWESSHCVRMCDYCARAAGGVERKRDLAKYFPSIVKILRGVDVPLTAIMLVDSWLHKGAAKHRQADVRPPDMGREEAECVVAWMLVRGLLVEDFHFTPYSTISYIKIAPDAQLILSENNELSVPLTQWARFSISDAAPKDLDDQISNSIKTIDATHSCKKSGDVKMKNYPTYQAEEPRAAKRRRTRSSSSRGSNASKRGRRPQNKRGKGNKNNSQNKPENSSNNQIKKEKIDRKSHSAMNDSKNVIVIN